MTTMDELEPLAHKANGVTEYFVGLESWLRQENLWSLVQAPITGYGGGGASRIPRPVRLRHAGLTLGASVDLLWRKARVAYPVHQDMLDELADVTSNTLSGRAFDYIPHTNPLLVFDHPLATTLPSGEPGEVIAAYVFGAEGMAGDPARQRRFCLTDDQAMNGLGFMTMSRVLDQSGGFVEWDMARMVVPLTDRFTVSGAVEQGMARYIPHHSQPGTSRAATAEWWLQILPPLLNVTLYTCTANADIEQATSRPSGSPRRSGSKRRRQEQAAAGPTRLFKVGWRLGPALAQARRAVAQYPATGTGDGQKPHQRRGHLRWTKLGPGRSEQRLDWINPYFVRLDLLAEHGLDSRLIPLKRKP